MKAWRYQPSAGKHKNRRAAKRAGSTNRNAYFAGGSSLLWALFEKAGLKREVAP